MTNATRTMLTMKRDTTTVSMKHVTKMTLIMTTTDHFQLLKVQLLRNKNGMAFR